MISKREIGWTHIYPDLAVLSVGERRGILMNTAGCYSAKQLDQETYELVMARFEVVLWDRVSAGAAKDPRLCRTCGRALKPAGNGYGECPEGCERRKVYAWDPFFWRHKVAADGKAGSRLIWKLRQLWDLLRDMLPEDEQTDQYLAAIIGQATGDPMFDLLEDGVIQWARVSATQAHKAVDALRDRLAYAVKRAPQCVQTPGGRDSTAGVPAEEGVPF